tara:strand:+ start:96 stop:443 length:348 start_codon:yes stop_codon:yes gene_type:complete
MIESCYKGMCILIGLFIISIILYNFFRENSIYKKKVIEGADLSDADVQKMSETAAELERLKLKQSNIVKDINTIKSETNSMDRKLRDEKTDIDAATKKAEEQGEDAKDGKNACPE